MRLVDLKDIVKGQGFYKCLLLVIQLRNVFLNYKKRKKILAYLFVRLGPLDLEKDFLIQREK